MLTILLAIWFSRTHFTIEILQGEKSNATQNWKLFEDPDFGLSFLYPVKIDAKTIELVKYNEHRFALAPEGDDIFFEVAKILNSSANARYEELKHSVQGEKGHHVGDLNWVQKGNYRAAEVSLIDNKNEESILIYYFEYHNTLYEIVVADCCGYPNLVNLIFSTLKFR